MELAWLEDFVEIVATRNFSAAASARHISQSAFSRRIKSLEAWLGAELIDRSTYPVRLTGAGNIFLPRAQELVRDIYQLRAECRNLSGTNEPPLAFSALHTLAIYFFPRWLRSLAAWPEPTRCVMHAGDFLESIEQLSLRKCDFALVYDHPAGLPVLETGPFESVQVGTDRLILVCGCDANGKPLYSVDEGEISEPIPYLAYAWNDGYLGKLIGLILSRRSTELPLSTVYQSSLAEGLKQMAIVGSGITWLPQICVRDAIAEGKLVQIGGSQMTIEIQIRLFRRSGHQSATIEAFWQQLVLKEAASRTRLPIRP
ncbi:LysR family transcriptional regulator [Pseudoruegeria sp. HB172150]|uniref:LysR family transcriptional regulator n=1 Tax=Pseudoruegeria sp. HB172150 TaxID=2721164 RepID=UPI001552D0F8|nr:LysR family transcriptional regulator [Pseudoruegeria sp. HB172150]